jgi:hypothetical protein
MHASDSDTDPAADCIRYPGFFAIESIALPMLLHLEQLVCYREYTYAKLVDIQPLVCVRS